MLTILVFLKILIVVYTHECDPASDQLFSFKNKTKGPIGIITTAAGAPVERRDASSSLNTNLLRNNYLIESLSHAVRERIPVRIVHPKGAGAFGYFVVTHDITDKCKAAFLSKIGKKTQVAVRFSLAVTEKGGSDLAREPRGFAVKFYTEEGNFDIPGFNIPIFLFKEPLLFGSFSHVMRSNPATDLFDVNALWDFLSLRPEGLFMFLIVFSDHGIPDGYRHMPGYSIHTYAIYNKAGKITYARFHFSPNSGIKNLNSTQAAALKAKDPNYSAKDLYNAIACGNYPTWTVSLQLICEEELKNMTFDPFDVTKLLPESQFPLRPVGKIILNRNPKNYFVEIEQMALCPANLVPGILGSPDKIFEIRRFLYRDAQRYRLGSNFDKISVNCPYRTRVLNYNRDGIPPVDGNGYDAPNYYPNSFHGPVPYDDERRPSLPNIYEVEANNFEQAREYYTDKTDDERNRLIQNIVNSLCRATNSIQKRAVQAFARISCDLADRIDKELKQNNCKC